jgi:RimJ/RimL family protein N-acetyltransferase
MDGAPQVELLAFDDKLIAAALGPAVVCEQYYGIIMGAIAAEVREAAEQTAALYARSPRTPPWLSYLALDPRSRNAVGACGFAFGPAPEGRVELTFTTFAPFVRRGYATAMVQRLVLLAAEQSEPVVLTARTLPTRGVATHVLEKCGFVQVGDVVDPDDGPAWEWEYDGPPVPGDAPDAEAAEMPTVEAWAFDSVRYARAQRGASGVTNAHPWFVTEPRYVAPPPPAPLDFATPEERRACQRAATAVGTYAVAIFSLQMFVALAHGGINVECVSVLLFILVWYIRDGGSKAIVTVIILCGLEVALAVFAVGWALHALSNGTLSVSRVSSEFNSVAMCGNVVLTGWAALNIRQLVVARRAVKWARRRGAGQCPPCGYNLRGNTNGRCPECGALVEVAPPPA